MGPQRGGECGSHVLSRGEPEEEHGEVTVQGEDSLQAHGWGGPGRSQGRSQRKAQNPWCLERAWKREPAGEGSRGRLCSAV